MPKYNSNSLLSKNRYFTSHIGGDIDDDQDQVNDQTKVLNKNKNKTNQKHVDRNNRFNPYKGYIEGLGLNGKSNRLVETSYININSANRNKEPKTILEESYLLETNPLSLTANSRTMTIVHRNHEYSVNDRITLQGADTKTITLRSVVNGTNIIDFENGSQYMTVIYNHGIPTSYDGSDIYVIINKIAAPVNSTFINNIPVNLLNKRHQLLLSTDNYDAATDRFYINMGKTFSGTYVPDTYSFTIKISVIAGIPLNRINAYYPISINSLQGYHLITSVATHSYTVELGAESLSTKMAGGSNIIVSRIESIETGYPTQSNYRVKLSKTFNNIISMRLVSSEFPVSSKVINSSNNKLYWQNLDEGDNEYSLAVDVGNYSVNELVEELQDKFYKTERITFTGNSNTTSSLTANQYIKVNIDTTTNIVKFQSYKETNPIKPIISIEPDIQEKPSLDNFVDGTKFKLTINLGGHGVSAGDKILISGAISHMGIPSSAINKEHTVYSVTDEDNFVIELAQINLSDQRKNTNGG